MELGFLKPLFDRPGPWASVYIDTSRATEDAARQQKLRERSVASQLVDRGADARTTRSLMDRLANEPVSGAPPGRALFAAGAEVVLDLPLAMTPPTNEATWSTLPHIAPLTGLRGDQPPCLVAYIDRTGADMELRAAGGREHLGQVDGKEWRGRGHRSIPADRQEWHYRNRVENGWNETAEIIAAELARQWPESGAQLLVLTGDSRERRAVHNQLPEQIRAVTVEAENGSRSPGSSKTLLDRQIEQACEDYARGRLESALERFRAGRGRPGEHYRAAGVDTGPGQAAEGVPAVVDAARTHQVATLLLGEIGPDAARELWIGPGVDDLAVQRSEAQAMGVAKPERARADDALLRSAAAADAEVLLVPEGVAGPAGGLGAVLRWSL
ncbi:baeRF2 domain-containing protein [Streptomyces sp. KR80]|uniref:baeRF2 domain-containing protein n=1 Tax=Streptomyces sp. KR80 TaxID=3457426 RepID=UPI003FD446EA